MPYCQFVGKGKSSIIISVYAEYRLLAFVRAVTYAFLQPIGTWMDVRFKRTVAGVLG